MLITIDCSSAARLIDEGAICFDTDIDEAFCDGLPVRLPSGLQEITRPILVCGTSGRTNAALVQHLQDQNLPAWQVIKASEHEVDPTTCSSESPID